MAAFWQHTMAIEGDLHVTLGFDGRRVRDVAIRSTRPHAIARLLRGHRPGAAIGIVSRLYAVCGAAQGVAAANACAAARDGGVADEVVARRDTLVLLECVQEHCSRLGLGWAAVMGEPPLVALVRRVRAVTMPLVDAGLRSLAQATPAEPIDARAAVHEVAILVADEMLGMPCSSWLAQSDVDALTTWGETGAVAPARWLHTLLRDFPTLGTSAIAPMPRADRSALQTAVVAPWHSSASFAERPSWNAVAVETGPLARMQEQPLVSAALDAWGNSVAARLVARLTELALLVQKLGADDASGGIDAFAIDGAGYASVHTARGLLLHRASLRDGCIADYAIVAPTEWNFRESGAFVCALAGVAAESEPALLRAAQVLAQAIDPCVACAIEVVHA